MHANGVHVVGCAGVCKRSVYTVAEFYLQADPLTHVDKWHCMYMTCIYGEINYHYFATYSV